MKTNTLLLAATVIIGTAFGIRAEEALAGVPYNTVNRMMAVLKAQKVEGVDCVPFYIKSELQDVALDAQKANFRIQTWDDEIEPLRVTSISDIPEETRSKFEMNAVKEGYTHVLWIPKGEKRFLDGYLMHNMPQGSISMIQGVALLKSSDPGADKEEE